MQAHAQGIPHKKCHPARRRTSCRRLNRFQSTCQGPRLSHRPQPTLSKQRRPIGHTARSTPCEE